MAVHWSFPPLFTLSLISILILVLGKNAAYYPNEIPNPFHHPEKCGRGQVKQSRICDIDNFLSFEGGNVVEGYINKIETCEIAVVIVNKISEMFVGTSTIEFASQLFARQLHDSWGVGKADKNDGVLIFLSIEDRSVYISVGKGIISMLNRYVLDSVINHMRPSLRSKNYGQAIERAILEIDYILKGESLPMNSNQNSDVSSYVFPTLFGMAFVVVIYYAAKEMQRVRRLKQGQAALNRFISEISDVKGSKYFTTTCPICLEDFPRKHSISDSSRPSMMEGTDPSTSLDSENPNYSSTRPATAQSDTYAADSGNTNNTNPKRAMSLRCGHMFCYTCLQEFLKKSSLQERLLCPVCRKPMDGSTEDGAPPRPPNSSTSNMPRPPDSSFPASHTPGSGQGSAYGRYDDPPSCSAHSEANRPPAEDVHYRWRYMQPDILFRLNRMRYLYPDVMTADTHNAMQGALQRGQVHELEAAARTRLTVVNQQLADIARRQAAQASGSRGAIGGNWGGGMSGGGHGGRW